MAFTGHQQYLYRFSGQSAFTPGAVAYLCHGYRGNWSMRHNVKNMNRVFAAAQSQAGPAVEEYTVGSVSSKLGFTCLLTYYASAATELEKMLSVGKPCCRELSLVCDGIFKCRLRSKDVPDSQSLLVCALVSHSHSLSLSDKSPPAEGATRGNGACRHRACTMAATGQGHCGLYAGLWV